MDEGKMSLTDDQKQEFTARDYQVQLLSIALNENTILYLPTGSGKTFVAVLLIKCLSQDLEKPYKEGGKRTFFAVNTVALVQQQGDYLARHTHLKIGKYSGDLNVDGWSPERWEKELIENQVLVLTCQILLDLLQHGTIKLDNINLIIFDECHHAVSDHCMRRVMLKFENCPKEDQPRVLGLSATLLNSNCKSEKVADEIKSLESTFLAKIATVDDISIVQEFSTNPQERLIRFMKGYPLNESSWTHLVSEVLDHLQTAKKTVLSVGSGVFSSSNEEYSTRNRHLRNLNKSPDSREKKKINAILTDVMVMVEDLGLYGGYWAALSGLIALHRRRLKMVTESSKLIITGCITHLTLVRKIISREMDQYSPYDQIKNFSTEKVIKLLKLLKEIENPARSTVPLKEVLQSKSKIPVKKPCALIFVERRQTAKTLYQILKNASVHYPGLDSIIPEFVVGIAGSPANQESAVNKKRHDEAIKRFRSGECNYLVASDVMEEGVDIPQCDLVVKFDLPKTFRSYVQSKGRARHSESKFMIFVPADDFEKFQKNLGDYQKIEKTLKQILVGKTDSRNVPTDEEINQLYLQDIPPYLSEDGTASVDTISSVALIHRYCSLLPQDKFTQLSPLWLLNERAIVRSPKKHSDAIIRKIVYLQLPINSPLRNIIKGVPMENKRLARRAVALIACVILHRMGELGKNDLLPVTHGPESLNDLNLFPHWKEESSDNGLPGSKKRSRAYSRQVADILTNCHPKPRVLSYVHHIYQKPVYERPPIRDSRGNALYDVLSMDRGYAIISSKKIPKLCDFSIYMSSGETEVEIGDEEVKVVTLTEGEIQDLENFHYMIFFDLLKICKQFVVVDKNFTINSYLIAPTCKDHNGTWSIDWDIVRSYPTLPKYNPFNEDEVEKLVVDSKNFLHEVVTPWYRGELSERNYIVSKVCDDMNAKSDFPSSQYDSFEMYFEDKYNLKIMKPELPLLEVKAISSRIDCIHPRGVPEVFDDTPCLSKRQMILRQGDFNEHLIPELVSKRHFPATLWLKATALPTILHRLSFLLLAYELRDQICVEANICSTVGPPNGDKWKRLEIESSTQVDREVSQPSRIVPSQFFATKDKIMRQDSEKMPIDIDREIQEINLLDIVQYHKFDTDENVSEIVKKIEWIYIEPASVPENVFRRLCDNPSSENSSCRCMGPELADVLCALTSASSGDVINLERMETLGDSFLKFAVSTYLFLKYPKTDEGKLTLIKGRMISNRNLFYCAQNKSLGGKLKIHSFAPNSDWYPPGFVVPGFMKEKLKNQEGITNSVLFDLTIPEADRRSGILSRETKNDIVASLEERKSNNIIGKMSSTLETLLGIQSVPDKNVADSVEALIGAWLLTGGSASALRLLGWFGILPQGPNGPAGNWQELVDDEAIKSAVDGFIKDQDNIRVIGGVIDWGPESELNKVTHSTEDFRLEKSVYEHFSKKKHHLEYDLNESGEELSYIDRDDECEDGLEYFNPEDESSCESTDGMKKLHSNEESEVSYQFPSPCKRSRLSSVLTTPEYENFSEEENHLEYDRDESSEELSYIDRDGECEDELEYFNPEDESSCESNDGMKKLHSNEESEVSDHFPSPCKRSKLSSVLTTPVYEKFSEEENQLEYDWDESSEELSCIGRDDECEDELEYFNPQDESSCESTVGMKKLHSNEESEVSDQFPSPCKRSRLSSVLTRTKQTGNTLLQKNVSRNAKLLTLPDDNDNEVKGYVEGIHRSRKTCSSIVSPCKAVSMAPFELKGNEWDLNSVESLLPGVAALEELINYKFKNRLLLLQAFTHASYHLNHLTECYQRLEFLGDAVLDYIITCHIFETCGKLSPGQLTDLRSALVNNITFASLAVRHGLHRHLLHLSQSLMDVMDSFVDFQVQRNHDVTEECLILMNEDDCSLSESVEVPKALGDILESLAGAIFLDSGLSLNTVWKVFYPMMKKEIDAFSVKVPKQPVRELLESDADVSFLPSEIIESETKDDKGQTITNPKPIVMVPVEIREKSTGKTRTFYGFGERKSLAKRAAAKLALRAMAPSKM